MSVIGLPFLYRQNLYTCSAVIENGKLIALVPHLPYGFLSSYFCDFEDAPCLIPLCGENIPFGKEFKFIVSYKDSCGFNTGFSFSFDSSSCADLILNPLAEPSKPLGSSAMRQGDITLEFGQTIQTSGLGGKFPSEIMIGEILNVNRLENELFQSASIQPAEDFSSLQTVLVVANFRPSNISPLEKKAE